MRLIGDDVKNVNLFKNWVILILLARLRIPSLLRMAENQFNIPNYMEKVNFHKIKWAKQPQKLHFFQIFAHFHHFGNLMIPILLEMAKNTFSVPSYMEKVSFQLIYLIKLVTRPQKCAKIVENYLKLVLFVACVTNFMKYIKQKDTFTCNLRH